MMDRGVTGLLLDAIAKLETIDVFGGVIADYHNAWSIDGCNLYSILDNKDNLQMLVDYLKVEYHAGRRIDPQIQKLRELLESAEKIADKVRPDTGVPAELRHNFIMLGYKCNDWIGWIDQYFPTEQSKQGQDNEEPVKQDDGFRHCLRVQDDKKNELLNKLHLLIDGNKGKPVALVIGLCVELGLMRKPTFGVLQAEFGNIGNASGFNKYFNSYRTSYTQEEKDGLKRHFEPFLE